MLTTPTASFVDDRGTIADLVVGSLDAATLVFTRAGAVRGNHFHAETWQWAYCLSGRLRVVSDDGAGPRTDVLTPGSMLLSRPLDAHAWEALEDTLMLVLARGPRAGERYEEDTHRLDVPLIG